MTIKNLLVVSGLAFIAVGGFMQFGPIFLMLMGLFLVIDGRKIQ